MKLRLPKGKGKQKPFSHAHVQIKFPCKCEEPMRVTDWLITITVSYFLGAGIAVFISLIVLFSILLGASK